MILDNYRSNISSVTKIYQNFLIYPVKKKLHYILKYINMLKHLNDFSIKEFEEYREILEQDEVNEVELLKLFGVDAGKLSVSELKSTIDKINGMILNAKLKKYYTINGVRYKATLNLMRLNAAQFIDFQAHMKDFKIQNILSVFLIPQTKVWYGWKDGKYNTNYDVIKTIDLIYNEFKMSDAKLLSDFFLSQSTSLLKIMKDYLTKKMYLKKKRQIKDLKNQK